MRSSRQRATRRAASRSSSARRRAASRSRTGARSAAARPHVAPSARPAATSSSAAPWQQRASERVPSTMKTWTGSPHRSRPPPSAARRAARPAAAARADGTYLELAGDVSRLANPPEHRHRLEGRRAPPTRDRRAADACVHAALESGRARDRRVPAPHASRRGARFEGESRRPPRTRSWRSSAT